MPECGWVKLHRKLINSRVFTSEGLLKVWVWCLLKSNHEKEWIPVITGKGATEIEVLPGQFVFGRKTASKELRMKERTVYDRMLKLEIIKNIAIQPNSHYSIISIINWDSYQDKKAYTPTGNTTAIQQATNTNKNDKKSILPYGNTSEPEVQTSVCPHDKIRNLYNTILPELPKCTVRNKTFDSQTRSRWNEDKTRQNIYWWESLFKTIRQSDFLMGRSKTDFQASLDWIVKPTNFTKILNGNYKNKNGVIPEPEKIPAFTVSPEDL